MKNLADFTDIEKGFSLFGLNFGKQKQFGTLRRPRHFYATEPYTRSKFYSLTKLYLYFELYFSFPRLKALSVHSNYSKTWWDLLGDCNFTFELLLYELTMDTSRKKNNLVVIISS